MSLLGLRSPCPIRLVYDPFETDRYPFTRSIASRIYHPLPYATLTTSRTSGLSRRKPRSTSTSSADHAPPSDPPFEGERTLSHRQTRMTKCPQQHHDAPPLSDVVCSKAMTDRVL
jgi:hypothetical protein